VAIPSCVKPLLRYKELFCRSSNIGFSTPLIKNIDSLGDLGLDYMVRLNNLSCGRTLCSVQRHCWCMSWKFLSFSWMYCSGVSHSLELVARPSLRGRASGTPVRHEYLWYNLPFKHPVNKYPCSYSLLPASTPEPIHALNTSWAYSVDCWIYTPLLLSSLIYIPTTSKPPPHCPPPTVPAHHPQSPASRSPSPTAPSSPPSTQ